MKFRREVCTAPKKRRLRNKHDARSGMDLQFVSAGKEKTVFKARDAKAEQGRAEKRAR
jgi:hypothetical protein